ncbi:hypothetical protein FB451DRAFT_1372662 [Mycena latifolia]|nr:hypothetical protein FB451DRAFT_1372662 [Mycena latifolia]
MGYAYARRSSLFPSYHIHIRYAIHHICIHHMPNAVATYATPSSDGGLAGVNNSNLERNHDAGRRDSDSHHCLEILDSDPGNTIRRFGRRASRFGHGIGRTDSSLQLRPSIHPSIHPWSATVADPASLRCATDDEPPVDTLELLSGTGLRGFLQDERKASAHRVSLSGAKRHALWSPCSDRWGVRDEWEARAKPEGFALGSAEMSGGRMWCLRVGYGIVRRAESLAG